MTIGRNKPCYDNADRVTDLVRDLVAEHRSTGDNTTSALRRIADAMMVLPRRVTTYFYRNQTIVVSDQERRRVVADYIAALHRLADEDDARAKRRREKALATLTYEKHLESLPIGGRNECRNTQHWSGPYQQSRAA